MQLVRHWLTLAFILLISAVTAAAQAPAQPAEGEAEFLVFIAGRQVGREQVRVSRAAGTWIINSTGNYEPPINLKVNRFEVKYGADWQPIELRVNAVQGSRVLELGTSFSVTNAINEITQNGVTNSKTDQISARTIVLPNNFYGAYEALAARLGSMQVGSDIPVYIAPQAEIRVVVKAIADEQVKTPAGTIATRKYDLTFNNPNGPLDARVTVDNRSRLVRVEIAAASLLVVRADLATVDTRTESTRNPTDADVMIPAAGFNLAGTLTTPAKPGKMRHPVVVLVSGIGQGGRDEVVGGVPVFAQLAGALADKGTIVLRYDKRGIGQSGGRIESATLQDYADDVVAAVKWLAKNRDVDDKRITVVGYREGGYVALLAAAREKRIASVVLLSAPGVTGSELILEQQRRALDELKTPAAERQQKIDLQKRINSAVISGKGWEGLPPEIRRQAETPLFRTLLAFDPAPAMQKVKQPILIVNGQADTYIPPGHAETLATIAGARKKALAVETRSVAGTIEKAVAAEAATAIAEWLAKQ